MSSKKTKLTAEASGAIDPLLFEEGYDRAKKLLHRLAGPDGFMASAVEKSNYRRIWARDSQIIGLAALASGDSALVDAVRRSLVTLAEHQGLHGEIPSNVDTESGRVSYGGMAGRVDADLWFIIGCGEYWEATGDDAFIELMRRPMERAWWVLGAWQFNNRGLLYVPETGDWADEYLHEGYVFYDQLLYYQAGRVMQAVRSSGGDDIDHALQEKLERLRRVLQVNYWFSDGDRVPAEVYHEILYRKGKKAAKRCRDRYWLPFFTPHGYGYRFDALANVLVSLVGLSCPERERCVDNYIEEEIWNNGRPALMPAFHPVIKPVDDDWEELKMTFSYAFKNRPYEYHNGGLWPMVTGFYVASLAFRGRTERARQLLGELHRANASEMEGEAWSFPEYLHGRTGEAGGTALLGWSAAAAVIGKHVLDGRSIFHFGAQRHES